MNDVVEHTDGGVGIERHACFHAGIVYLLDGAVQVGACLVVYVHHVGSEGFDLPSELARVNNHQVYVERLLANLGHGLQHGESETDVGHKDAVHHVEVEPIGFTAVNHVDVLAQIGEVGSKERRGYLGHRCYILVKSEE